MADSNSREKNAYFKMFFDLVGDLLDMLHNGFPECTGTDQCRTLYKKFVVSDIDVKLKLIDFWNKELGQYSNILMEPSEGLLKVCALLKAIPGYKPITMAEFLMKALVASGEKKKAVIAEFCHPANFIGMLKLEDKWNDKALDEQSKHYLLQFLVHMNASSSLFSLVPDSISKEFYDVVEQFRSSSTRNFAEFGGKLIGLITTASRSGKITQRESSIFFTNMEQITTAISCLTFGVNFAPDQVAEKHSDATSLPDLSANGDLQEKILGVAKDMNFPKELLTEDKMNKFGQIIKNLPPDVATKLSDTMQSGDFSSIINPNFMKSIADSLQQSNVSMQDLLSGITPDLLMSTMQGVKDSDLVKSNPTISKMMDNFDPSALGGMLSGQGNADSQSSLFNAVDPDV